MEKDSVAIMSLSKREIPINAETKTLHVEAWNFTCIYSSYRVGTP